MRIPTVTKSECIQSKYTDYEKLKINNSSRISKTIYHNGSYLMLFGKKILQSLSVWCVLFRSFFGQYSVRMRKNTDQKNSYLPQKRQRDKVTASLINDPFFDKEKIQRVKETTSLINDPFFDKEKIYFKAGAVNTNENTWRELF